MYSSKRGSELLLINGLDRNLLKLFVNFKSLKIIICTNNT